MRRFDTIYLSFLTAIPGYREDEYNKLALHLAKVPIFKTKNAIRKLHYNNEMIDQRINYVHEYPVRAMIVEKAEDYLFSSVQSKIDEVNYASLGGMIEVEVIP
ncbi:hypothetical protein [Roseimarinus sediminis]|uniref:hypothetical protein n=1 Tax=Roseimarinus sediminis TaxID=1610899 RepID=UPI003D20FB85